MDAERSVVKTCDSAEALGITFVIAGPMNDTDAKAVALLEFDIEGTIRGSDSIMPDSTEGATVGGHKKSKVVVAGIIEEDSVTLDPKASGWLED